MPDDTPRDPLAEQIEDALRREAPGLIASHGPGYGAWLSGMIAANLAATRPSGDEALHYVPAWGAWEKFAERATKEGSGPTRDQTTGAAMMLGWLIDTYLPALATPSSTPDVERLREALTVLADMGGIVFASDDKQRPMLAQSVVRKIASDALSGSGS